MNKDQLSLELKDWLRSYLSGRAEIEVIDVIIPESNISKLNIDSVKSLSGYSTWDFKPDVLGIIKLIKSEEVKLVLLNRTTSAISLREIGEIRLYSQLVDPLMSFLISLNGVSSDVAVLLLDNQIEQRLLKYAEDKEIIIFTWSESSVKQDSVIPLSSSYLFQ
jgi:hypothetical protein